MRQNRGHLHFRHLRTLTLRRLTSTELQPKLQLRLPKKPSRRQFLGFKCCYPGFVVQGNIHMNLVFLILPIALTKA